MTKRIFSFLLIILSIVSISIIFIYKFGFLWGYIRNIFNFSEWIYYSKSNRIYYE